MVGQPTTMISGRMEPPHYDFGALESAGIKYIIPGIKMDFGQRGVILTLNEVRSLIRRPYNNLLEGYFFYISSPNCNGNKGRFSLIIISKRKWAEDMALTIFSFKSKYEGVKNGRSKRIE